MHLNDRGTERRHYENRLRQRNNVVCYGTICKPAPIVKWCTICQKIGTKYDFFRRFALHQMSVFLVPYVKCFLIRTISKKKCTIRKMQTKSLGVIYRGIIVLPLSSPSSSSPAPKKKIIKKKIIIIIIIIIPTTTSSNLYVRLFVVKVAVLPLAVELVQ